MKASENYRLGRALRPFSLVVAVIASSLGGLLAWQEGFHHSMHLVLVIVGSLLAQAGINLVNDLEDLPLLPKDAKAIRARILSNTKIGGLFIAAALVIGVYFAWLRGWQLMALIAFVAVLALSYNLGPLNFKRRGLALFQVFLLMGVCLVEGAYMAMAGQFSMHAFWLSLPVSVLVSLLLLSNELRDWESDSEHGIKTLTVRMGYSNAVWLYVALVVSAYALAAWVIVPERLSGLWYLLLPLPLLVPISRYLRADVRPALTPMTGRFFFLFGLAWLAAVVS